MFWNPRNDIYSEEMCCILHRSGLRLNDPSMARAVASRASRAVMEEREPKINCSTELASLA